MLAHSKLCKRLLHSSIPCNLDLETLVVVGAWDERGAVTESYQKATSPGWAVGKFALNEGDGPLILDRDEVPIALAARGTYN